MTQLENVTERMEKLRFEVRRNFRGMPFTPLMTKETKLQVERRVVEVLGELCGRYCPVGKIAESDKDWLFRIGVNVGRSELHDAAGLNEDYPIGRGVFIEDAREFVVLVNFEDHIQIIMLPEKGARNSLKKSILRFSKLLGAFEKMGFATDGYLGYLSTCP